ncbi:MAG: hypothetical protein ACOZNI_12470 [Myxococcota bacterium]
MSAVATTEAGTWPREILVLKRASGYLRLHLPPLLYVPALATKLERALIALRGVRRVVVDRARARLSVYYDPWLTDDRAALLEIDRQATPQLARMEPETFTAALVEQRKARRERIVHRLAQAAYLGALVWAHAWALGHWIADPLRHWWAWLLVGFGIWTHRRQIAAIPQV